jgi:hypothetical protein
MLRGRAALVVTALLGGCGGPQEAGAEGADCYRDRDCQAGLVCVGPAEARKCSSDVSGLVSTVEGAPPPEDAGAPVDDAAAPPDDAAAPSDPDAG